MCVEATRLLDARPERPYRHVVVDEAQDLAAWQWRLLRAAAAPAPDDLFIAGDAHQRIYSHRVSLRRLGIDVTGRSERLSINYRTTAEILAWSVGVLHCDQVEGLDADVETLTGCRSEVHGEAPAVAGFDRREDELAGLLATVRGWIDDGVDPDRIGVAARTTALVRAAADALARGGIDATVLGTVTARDGAVSVATMHRMKGLEFRCVALVGVEEGQVPHPSAVTAGAEDAATHRVDVERKGCLLFVACTRARERLAVSWRGAPSPFLLGDRQD